MRRPAVSVVMPFRGDLEAARQATGSLRSLATADGDELILADNAGVAASLAEHELAGIRVVNATGERSPAHARNVGAAHAGNEWILFLDADCQPGPGLLEGFFAPSPDADAGALAGEVVPDGAARTLAERYGAARSFLDQRAHLAHPYLPRAVAANLLVRTSVFRALGGFLEGLRAAEDTDFCWRLQQAGWRLELRDAARVEHRYRGSVGELRRQWRAYAAGRAWLGRRYPGFRPQPAVARIPRRFAAAARVALRATPAPRAVSSDAKSHRGVVRIGFSPSGSARAERIAHLGLDALLAAEELRGLLGSNRPSVPARPALPPEHRVLVAERFPSSPDTAAGTRVEAAGRPEAPGLASPVSVIYREDDGLLERLVALGALALRHPRRCRHDRELRAAAAGGGSAAPRLAALAPAALRLAREPFASVQPLGEDAQRTAARLAALAGRPVDEGGRSG